MSFLDFFLGELYIEPYTTSATMVDIVATSKQWDGLKRKPTNQHIIHYHSMICYAFELLSKTRRNHNKPSTDVYWIYAVHTHVVDLKTTWKATVGCSPFSRQRFSTRTIQLLSPDVTLAAFVMNISYNTLDHLQYTHSLLHTSRSNNNWLYKHSFHELSSSQYTPTGYLTDSHHWRILVLNHLY